MYSKNSFCLVNVLKNKWYELNLSEQISTISSIATVIGVMLVVWQVSLAVNSIEDNAENFLNNGVQEINKVFIERPELWPYFNEGKVPNPNDKNYNSILALADMHIDFFDSLWIQTDNVEDLNGGEGWESWDSWIRDVTRESPILCERFNKIKGWYSKSFTRYLLYHCDNAANRKNHPRHTARLF